MPSRKQRKLENTVAALEQRHGPGVVRRASTLTCPALPARISTGIPQLDAATGCDGAPIGYITLLSGRVTSGKTTVGYLTLANAQGPTQRGQPPNDVALLDLAHNCDPNYAHSCGVDLDQLLLMRPHPGPDVVDLLLELLRGHPLRAILVNSLPDLTYNRKAYSRLNAALPLLNQRLRGAGCALIFLDDPSPRWLRWLNWDRSWAVRQRAGLHIQMRRERLLDDGRNTGYAARAAVLHSRWPRPGHEPLIQILFNGHLTIDGKTRQARPSQAHQ
jgi:hypothetical protein